MMIGQMSGGFTLPGESGYERLTLELAKKWGADVIRDSDGTKLSTELLEAGYDIYSTICIIRDHNEWAKKNQDKLQQTFLVTAPKVAENDTLEIELLENFFEEQFAVNDRLEAMKYWQVYDRTTDKEVSREHWFYDSLEGTVQLKRVTPWHKYTVSFLAYRIWEEISMYNHITNHWKTEHLMQIDPMYPETQKYLLIWMRKWCENHPHTNVVRFTSMFYNFVWMWGSKEKCRNLYTDWASYDFTVSDRALQEFEREYGYAMKAEDFIHQGKFHVTHMPGNRKKQDWMEFINRFVVEFGKQLIEIVHEYGKRAYVFYDDSWVGIEPYGKRFEEFGFDGIIKCVFNGYEARLCSGVKTKVHELRLHPYLFPTGVSGKPSFLEEGNPKSEAQQYWQKVRRALLRSPVDRIGLGGYLHLVEKKPDFVEYIEQVANEFRIIRSLHQSGKPYMLPRKIGILHYWGKLRSWTLSGHFHETCQNDLIHIIESLSGMSFDVSFLNFEDIRNGDLKELDVIINAGFAGSAWSGGNEWQDEKIIELLTKWVYEGGTFIGVNEPSAVPGYDTFFRMSHVLGVDEDMGERICHGKWNFDTIEGIVEGVTWKKREGIYLTDGTAQVLKEQDGIPVLTVKKVGQGYGIYLGGYEFTIENTQMLQNLILYGYTQKDLKYIPTNRYTECTYFPEGRKLVVINNTDNFQETEIDVGKGKVDIQLEAFEMKILEI